MSLSAFLAENALPVEHIKFAVSPRFVDKDKKPVEWEIKTITGTEDAEILCQTGSRPRQEKSVSERN